MPSPASGVALTRAAFVPLPLISVWLTVTARMAGDRGIHEVVQRILLRQPQVGRVFDEDALLAVGIDDVGGLRRIGRRIRVDGPLDIDLHLAVPLVENVDAARRR